MQAGVVVAALLDRVRRSAREQLLRRVQQRRHVAVDELGLEREGRGGDDDAAVLDRVEQGGDEVAERLAGAGACLDEEVGAVVH